MRFATQVGDEDPEPESPRRRYRHFVGFEVSMLEAVSRALGCRLEFRNAIGSPSSKVKEGEWTGMVGELAAGRIDVVVAQSLTSSRPVLPILRRNHICHIS